MTITIRLKRTAYGDKYLIRNGYKSVTQGWIIGAWETIPGRYDVSPSKEAADATLWECEMPVEAWEIFASRSDKQKRP